MHLLRAVPVIHFCCSQHCGYPNDVDISRSIAEFPFRGLSLAYLFGCKETTGIVADRHGSHEGSSHHMYSHTQAALAGHHSLDVRLSTQ